MRYLGQRLYYGWLVLAAVAGLNFANGATTIGVLTVFILPLTEAFGWTRTQISVVTSVGAVLGALTAPFMGRVTDRFGARLPLTLGGVCIVVALLYLAAVQSLLGFYVAFSLARLADQGFVQVCSPPAIAKWFQRYRGRAMAVLFFTSSAGGATLPLLVHFVIQTWHWRVAWEYSAALCCAWVSSRVPCWSGDSRKTSVYWSMGHRGQRRLPAHALPPQRCRPRPLGATRSHGPPVRRSALRRSGSCWPRRSWPG